MKTVLKLSSISLIVSLFVFYPVKGENPVDDPELLIEAPVLIDPSVFLYQAGDIYLGGQPTEKTLDTLLEIGITLIINIRTDPEVMTHNIEGYREEDYAREIGLDYIQIPIGGDAGFPPEAVTRIDQAIQNAGGKVLIHCRSAGRATLAWMAWLVRYRDYTIDKAVELGKKAQFSFPLEDLLGYPVTIKKAG